MNLSHFLKNKAYWIQQRVEMYGKSVDLGTIFIAEYTVDLHQTDNELKDCGFLREKQKSGKQIYMTFSTSLWKVMCLK